jgi:hypothetical protein
VSHKQHILKIAAVNSYVVFANVVLPCNKQDSNAPETYIEEFHAVEKRSLDSSKAQNMAGDLLDGYPELLLQVQIV